jgi:predicted nucleic acid-binding protein
MDTGAWILVVVVLLVVIALAVFLMQQRRSRHLQQQFGPEYERTVARTGGRRSAESQLAAREHRRQDLTIVPLDAEARARYEEAWRRTQGRFVDDPGAATSEADVLVGRVMRDRGYPVDDFEQQAADVSVDHPRVVENYRAAHALSRAHEQGLAGTDDLRQAFVHYRSLFAELLDADGDGRKEAPDDRPR